MAVAVAGGRPTGFEARPASVFLWMVRLSSPRCRGGGKMETVCGTV